MRTPAAEEEEEQEQAEVAEFSASGKMEGSVTDDGAASGLARKRDPNRLVVDASSARGGGGGEDEDALF